MTVVPVSLSRRFTGTKRQSDIYDCAVRIKMSESILQSWEELAAACKAYNGTQSAGAKAIRELIEPRESEKGVSPAFDREQDGGKQKQESSFDGENKEEHRVAKDPKKAKKNKANIVDDATTPACSRPYAAVTDESESKGLKELLEDFEIQSRIVEENNSFCKLLEIDTDEMKTTKGNSSRKLAKLSLSRNFSRLLSLAFNYRSSKVYSLPNAQGGNSDSLELLCAWEKQLCHQVEKILIDEKTGKRCDVYTAKQSAALIWERIQKLKNEKLEPHLDQLLDQLTRDWEKNAACYKEQAEIMSNVHYKLLAKCLVSKSSFMSAKLTRRQ